MQKNNTNVTVIIHTFNEEHNIKQAIESARNLTNTIVVVDMQSNDKTAHVVKEMNVELISIPHAHYVEPARKIGILHAKTDWVFLLDADERFSKELVSEINEQTSGYTITHYKVPRKEYFARKQWLKHGGWWPNHQIRLIHVPSFKDWPEAIHSTPIMRGELGYLSNPLLHYSKNSYHEIVNKTTIFENVESNLLYNAGKKVAVTTFFRKFFGELNRRLILKRGYLDGGIGIIESIYQAYSKTITYLYLYEKTKSRRI